MQAEVVGALVNCSDKFQQFKRRFTTGAVLVWLWTSLCSCQDV